MYFEYDEKVKITYCFTEKTDKCILCKIFDDCPLVEAISNHTVYPAGYQIVVDKCRIFETENL